MVTTKEDRRIKHFWSNWGQVFVSSLNQRYSNDLWQEYVENVTS